MQMSCIFAVCLRIKEAGIKGLCNILLSQIVVLNIFWKYTKRVELQNILQFE